MKKTLSAQDRALQIELVRARAAIERQSLRRNINELSDAVRPGALMRAVVPGFSNAGSGGPIDWALRLFSLSRRYPYLTSGASALLSGVGKRHRLVKISLAVLVGWQLSRSLKKTQDDMD